MLIDNIPLRVKLGGYALEFQRLQKLKPEVDAALLALGNARDALTKAKKAAAPTGSDPNHHLEVEALRYAAKKRAGLEVFYLGEDVFHEYQRVSIAIMEEELDARRRLDVLHSDLKGRAKRMRKAEYFMSNKCVFERFELQELAHEGKVRMMQEHADFLVSLKIVEEEERLASISRAKSRRQGALQQPTVSGRWNTFSPQHGAPSQTLPPQQQMHCSMGSGSLPVAGTTPYAPQQQVLPVFHHQQPQRPQQQMVGFYAAAPPSVSYPTYGQPVPPQQHHHHHHYQQQQQQHHHHHQYLNAPYTQPLGRAGYLPNGRGGPTQR